MERAELARLLEAPPAAGDTHEMVVVEERDPARFRAAFAGAVAAGGPVLLANPDWAAAERAQFHALCETKLRTPYSKGQTSDSQLRIPHAAFSRGWLGIPTGGSAGQLKLARHDQDTLQAAARGFAGHFGVVRVNAVGVLPLHHVGGLMGWLRCVLTGGEFLAAGWKKIEGGEMPALAEMRDGWFLSLVPTQLQRLLAQPAAVAWLRGFRAVLVGGGPAWPELAEAGARAGVPLAFTYGATETAAAVAALRPEEFLAGGRGCGAALPHARVTVDGAGAIIIGGESLFRGYWPEWREPGAWVTDDWGEFDGRGSLQVRGRRDAVIITGGEKVEPGEVEAALRTTGEFDDVAVVGVPDVEWGCAVVACYPAAGRKPDLGRVAAGLKTLAAWKRPARFVAVTAWPRDAAGKIDRVRLAGSARWPKRA